MGKELTRKQARLIQQALNDAERRLDPRAVIRNLTEAAATGRVMTHDFTVHQTVALPGHDISHILNKPVFDFGYRFAGDEAAEATNPTPVTMPAEEWTLLLRTVEDDLVVQYALHMQRHLDGYLVTEFSRHYDTKRKAWMCWLLWPLGAAVHADGLQHAIASVTRHLPGFPKPPTDEAAYPPDVLDDTAAGFTLLTAVIRLAAKGHPQAKRLQFLTDSPSDTLMRDSKHRFIIGNRLPHLEFNPMDSWFIGRAKH